MQKQKSVIVIIGAGNMGGALAAGLCHDVATKRVIVTDPDPEKLQKLQAHFPLEISTDNQQAAAIADLVLFAVKPQIFADVAKPLAPVIRKKCCLVISVAAGIRTGSLHQWLGDEVPIVRCMPNMPALIRAGITALFATATVSASQKMLAETVLMAVGETVWLQDENLLDAVTALSGSGPAYFFYVMNAMQEAGISLGLPTDIAKQLTLQTALGTTMLAKNEIQTASLKELMDRITSPNGTTEAALEILEQNDVRDIFKNAIKTAMERSKELAKIY